MRDGPTYRLIEALLKEGHPLMIMAARQIAAMRAERDEMSRRIHNQRRSNRENWEIVEQRNNCMGSPAARRSYINLLKRYKSLKAANK